MENQMKIVRFDTYCITCKHYNVPETEEPCNECLTCGANLYSERPVNYEEGNVTNG